jgi:hypothetical protein
MATNTNNAPRQRDGEGPATVGSHARVARPEPRPSRKRKPPFDKERATLWLLTLSLGLGFGAVLRVVESGNPTAAAASNSQLAVQRTQVAGYGTAGTIAAPTQNQGVMVLPQRTFSARATTRMS